MSFDEALDQVRELLRRRQRVTYQTLKVRFALDDALQSRAAARTAVLSHSAISANGRQAHVQYGSDQDHLGKVCSNVLMFLEEADEVLHTG
jgi:hypothetical protein